ncbi:MAG TPA: hypothetical protein VLV50_03245 [Stellaceae bacterium]|nr:hypothetical protein [Stellaceae bacterium]
MTTPLTRAEFDALLARAGLVLGEAQKGEIYRAWGTLEQLIERVRGLPPEAEPATIYETPRAPR